MTQNISGSEIQLGEILASQSGKDVSEIDRGLSRYFAKMFEDVDPNQPFLVEPTVSLSAEKASRQLTPDQSLNLLETIIYHAQHNTSPDNSIRIKRDSVPISDGKSNAKWGSGLSPMIDQLSVVLPGKPGQDPKMRRGFTISMQHLTQNKIHDRIPRDIPINDLDYLNRFKEELRFRMTQSQSLPIDIHLELFQWPMEDFTSAE